ncbi:MAG TPA: DUF445 domain-containing protein [Marmoricola sp.]|nr:DUF445 domain-containing protein [Marmoricola sp.]
MSISLITPDTEADAQRRTRLRRMKAVALGLLVLAAVVYGLTYGDTGFLGFVNAGAEASMVGAMADWFAVTALFRHPLGLPIPHTALVPKRKDDFGESLEEFFAENFLQEQVVRERLAASDVVRRLGHWLAEPDHARRVVAEGAALATIGLGRIRDEDIAGMVEDVVLPRFLEEPISPVAGSLLAEIVADDAHHGLVDLALGELHRWLLQNEDTFTEVLAERAPWWAPPRLNEAVTLRLHREAIRWVEEIRDDPRHHAREVFDSFLGQLAHDLQHDPATQARAEALKDRVIGHPQVVSTAISLWTAFRRALLDALEKPDGLLRERAVAELTALGTRAAEDPALRQRLETWASDVAVFVVERYGDELTAVITHTINRWDGREAARKIELHVGRDLQFIRINGTVVGGLVGLVIHAASLLIP